MHANWHFLAGAIKFIPGVLRAHAFRLSEKQRAVACGAREGRGRREVCGGMRH